MCLYGTTGSIWNRCGNVRVFEEINRLSRDILIKTKDVVQKLGCELIYADTDSIFIKNLDGVAPPNQYEKIVSILRRETGLPISVEHNFKFLVLLPLEANEKIEALKQYHGITHEGQLVVRGVEKRRHDTPKFIKKFQTGSDNVPKPMAYVAFKGSDGQVQRQDFELDQDNVVTVNQNDKLSFSGVEGISISMVKITDVNKKTYGVPVQDNSVLMAVPAGVYTLNAIAGPYAYTSIVVVSAGTNNGQVQGQGQQQDSAEITRVVERVIIDTITFVDIWIITLFQPIAAIPVGLPADLALNGIGEACYGYDLDMGLNCNNLASSIFDAPLRHVGELTDEDTKDTDDNDNDVDNDADPINDSPIGNIPQSNACQQGCINEVAPSGHDNPPHTGDNTASSHQSGDDNNNDNEGDEGGSNEGGEGDNEESGSSEEED